MILRNRGRVVLIFLGAITALLGCEPRAYEDYNCGQEGISYTAIRISIAEEWYPYFKKVYEEKDFILEHDKLVDYEEFLKESEAYMNSCQNFYRHREGGSNPVHLTSDLIAAHMTLKDFQKKEMDNVDRENFVIDMLIYLERWV